MSIGRFSIAFLMMGLLFGIIVFTPVHAQSEIQISRPNDGATVRETVNILIPVSSVPEGGFVSYTIDGRFRHASAAKTGDSKYFIYRWDTKADDPDHNLSEAERKPRDGKHTIEVQAYRSSGKKYGQPKQIAVSVKNNLSASDIPSNGLKLRYKRSTGVTDRYKFRYTLDIKDIQGRGQLATAGEAIEGAEGVIKRTIEDVMPDKNILVRYKLTNTLKTYQSGFGVPTAIITKPAYQIEDGTGHVLNEVKTYSAGVPISIDLLDLPPYNVKLGDTWSSREPVFRNVVTGESVSMTTSSTLEGLEWESGYVERSEHESAYACARIKTTFSGSVKIPFSAIFTEPVSVTGETITYFAYDSNKVIASTTRAVGQARVDQSLVSRFIDSRGGAAPGMPGSAPPGPPGILGAGGRPGTDTAGTSQTMNVKFEINQSLEYIR